ncbi:hypothetical protein PVAG01_05871 [Phlyctema vagabunda]|uniref:Alpha/beta-hydrolase n=1 Tax=Phlyctema vagabunda TaxID=108571 RepID=A0ABR4PEL3_9HELO
MFTTTCRPYMVLRRASRPFSTRQLESHTVECGSAGSITVDLYNRGSVASTTPYIIYLPPNPNITTSPFPEFLSSHPVARINYRWNHQPSSHLTSSPLYQNHSFPTPLHDVLYGYSWLVSYLSAPEFYVYGSHLGGTLATSLALTESRATRIKNTSKIRGLIAKDAIFDWTGVATSKDDTRGDEGGSHDPERESHRRLWTTQTLHALKTRLFSEPAQCFDSFASPILFFRSAGLAIPESFPGLRPAASLRSSVSLDDIFLDEDGNIVERQKPAPESPSAPAPTAHALPAEATRRSHLTFPPRGSGLRIPRSLIMSTLASIPLAALTRRGKPTRTRARARTTEGEGELEAQAQEMCHVMQRSITLHESKDRRVWDDSFDAHTEAETRVRYRTLVEGDAEREERRLVREWLEDDA